MTEKLIPFDFVAFEAEPSRLRHRDGRKAAWAEPVRGLVVARFECTDFALLYLPAEQQNYLRLAAKARTVRVRLYRGETGFLYAVTDVYGADLETTQHGTKSWVSDIIEVEISE